MLILSRDTEPESIQLFSQSLDHVHLNMYIFARPDSVVMVKMYIEQEKIWEEL